jgi:hypothetical protein
MAMWLQQLHTQAFSTSFLPSRRRRILEVYHQHRRFYHGKLYFINNSTAVAVAEGRSFSFVSDPTIRYPRCFVFFSSFAFSALLFATTTNNTTKDKQTWKYTTQKLQGNKKCWALFLFYLQPILSSVSSFCKI